MRSHPEHMTLAVHIVHDGKEYPSWIPLLTLDADEYLESIQTHFETEVGLEFSIPLAWEQVEFVAYGSNEDWSVGGYHVGYNWCRAWFFFVAKRLPQLFLESLEWATTTQADVSLTWDYYEGVLLPLFQSDASWSNVAITTSLREAHEILQCEDAFEGYFDDWEEFVDFKFEDEYGIDRLDLSPFLDDKKYSDHLKGTWVWFNGAVFCR